MDTPDLASLTLRVLLLAFATGAAFGAICQRTRFCTMGAVADLVIVGDWRRMRMWLLAIGIAILGTAALHGGGIVDIDKSIYRGSELRWLSHLVGGFAFGVGMILACGCAGKTLIRAGSGSLKALIVLLVLAVSAVISLRGLFAVFRNRVLDPVSLHLPAGQDLPALLAGFGMPAGIALALVAALLGGGFCLWALAGTAWREVIPGGLGVGFCVLAGWLISGSLGYLPENPETLQEAFLATNSGRMETLSFVAPPAYGLEWLMYWSDTSRHLSFAIALAGGTLTGACLAALLSREFRWESFANAEDVANHLLGAVLMGFGGVTALGCSIGQGISGVSTLALGSLLSLAAILAGAVAALRWQERRLRNA